MMDGCPRAIPESAASPERRPRTLGPLSLNTTFFRPQPPARGSTAGWRTRELGDRVQRGGQKPTGEMKSPRYFQPCSSSYKPGVYTRHRPRYFKLKAPDLLHPIWRGGGHMELIGSMSSKCRCEDRLHATSERDIPLHVLLPV